MLKKRRILDKEYTLKIIILFISCLLIFYFTYQAGRASLKKQLKKKSYQISTCQGELELLNRQLKMYKEQDNSRENIANEAQLDSFKQADSFNQEKLTLKVGSSILLFDEKVVFSLLNLSQIQQSVDLQFNFLADSKIIRKTLLVGGSIKLSIEGSDTIFILELLEVNSAIIKIISY